MDHSVDLSVPDLKEKKIRKEWTEAIKNSKSIIEMHNSKYQCHMATCCTAS